MASVSEAFDLIDYLEGRRDDIARQIRAWKVEHAELLDRVRQRGEKPNELLRDWIKWNFGYKMPIKPTPANLLQAAIDHADNYRYCRTNSHSLCPKICGADDAWYEGVDHQYNEARLYFEAYLNIRYEG